AGQQGGREHRVLKKHCRRPNVPHRQIGVIQHGSMPPRLIAGAAFVLKWGTILSKHATATMFRTTSCPLNAPVSAHTRPGSRSVAAGQGTRATSDHYAACGTASRLELRWAPEPTCEVPARRRAQE